MQLDITGQHLDITDALRQHLNKRMQRLNKHRETPLGHLRVVLQVNKNTHTCDMMTRYDSEEFVVQCSESDMYAAIDRAIDKLERQLRDAKTRKISRRH